MRLLSMIIAVLLCSALAWGGSMYVWKDAEGNIRTGDKPPAQAETVGSMAQAGAKLVAAAEQESGIELFVTEWCPYCKMAISHLKSRNVEFTVYNVEYDQEANKRKLRLSNGQGGVPFAMIYGHPIMGFSPDAYDEALRAGR